MVCIKTKDTYEDIAKDIETGFDTSNYESELPLSKVKNKKLNELIKDELCVEIMTELPVLRLKPYIYLTNGNNKKIKRQKKVRHKTKILI